MVRAESSEPADPIDYVPDWAKRRKQEEVIELTDEQMIASMTAFFNCGPGKAN